MSRSMRASTRRAIVITSAAALVAVAIMPAVAAVTEPQGPAGTALTMHQQATDDAQKLVVASEAQSVELDRDVYVASTPAEIAEARAAESARFESARRAAEAEAARQAAATSSGGAANPKPPSYAAGKGEVRYPLPAGSYYVSRSIGGSHLGADMMADEWTPIYAAHAGVVTISDESFSGFGNAVVLEGVVGGAPIETAYAHMVPGSRLVQAGETVKAGQQIGSVGNTGNSWGNHLHIEVHINGDLMDPIVWLAENAG